MSYAVVKGSGYILVHAPDMVRSFGTTRMNENVNQIDSEYLQNIDEHLRSFEEVVAYPPNQVFIGNVKPEDLREYDFPWYTQSINAANRVGSLGEIMPQDEFFALLKISDVFDLVKLDKAFTILIKQKISKHPLITSDMVSRLKEGEDKANIEKFINEQKALPLYNDNKLIGCVKRAHELDDNLNARIITENLISKASSALAFLHLIENTTTDVKSIDYVIECSEQACGNEKQRGGGNFAKAIAEMVGAVNATGSDTRAFCAAPIHALVQAAALVKAGVYNNVVVVGGGAASKLGLNGKDHVMEGIPILEDVLGATAILVSKNDGVSPVIRTDLVGKHTVGTGSSPQAIITSLIVSPLDKAQLKVTDIDRYSVEMQNPDITRAAGAGDVPEANYKMIGALGIKRNEITHKEISGFIEKHGMPGWAPTQGHIQSGIPYIGHALKDFKNNVVERVMIVGKGSLFLARMTNQFDGISIIMEKNDGKVMCESVPGITEDVVKKMIAEAMRGFASQVLKNFE